MKSRRLDRTRTGADGEWVREVLKPKWISITYCGQEKNMDKLGDLYCLFVGNTDCCVP